MHINQISCIPHKNSIYFADSKKLQKKSQNCSSSNSNNKNCSKPFYVNSNLYQNHTEKINKIAFSGLFSSDDKNDDLDLPDCSMDEEKDRLWHENNKRNPIDAKYLENLARDYNKIRLIEFKRNKDYKYGYVTEGYFFQCVKNDHLHPPIKIYPFMFDSKTRIIGPKELDDMFKSDPINESKKNYNENIKKWGTLTKNPYIVESEDQYLYRYNGPDNRKYVYAWAYHDDILAITSNLLYYAVMGRPYMALYNYDKNRGEYIALSAKLSFADDIPDSDNTYACSRLILYGLNPLSDNFKQISEKNSKKESFLTDYYHQYIIPAMDVKTTRHYEASFDKPDTAFSEYDIFPGDGIIYSNIRKFGHEHDSENQNPKLLQKLSKAIYSCFYYAMDAEHYEKHQNVLSDTIIGNSLLTFLYDKCKIDYDSKTNTVSSPFEYTFDDLIKIISNEEIKPIVSIGTPYYYVKKLGSFEKAADFISLLVDRSNGLIKGFESYSRAYDKDPEINMNEVAKFNEYLKEKTGLYET